MVNRKKESASRLSSAPGQSSSKDPSSLASSTVNGAIEPKKPRFPIWPEWNEADVNSEKWDSGKGGKEKEKPGKTSALHLFDDPEGKIEMPPKCKVHTWKRPHDFMTNLPPVIVKEETPYDVLLPNEHLVDSQLMRRIISEMSIMWKINNTSHVTNDKVNTTELVWKPWDHIYSLCKAVKGHVAQYNSYGKYVIKLYWMGCWRKIIVDDTLPFNENNQLLLPATTIENELWPMLLSKALIKLANVSLPVSAKRERGRFTVVQSLTGWLPEIIPLQHGYFHNVWHLVKEIVPEFKLPDEESPEVDPNLTEVKEDEPKPSETKIEIPIIKQPEKPTKEKHEGKEPGKKKGEKEKAKSLPHSARLSSETINVVVTPEVPLTPQMVVYASYLPLNLSEKKITVLGRMADSAECLRTYGMSHIYSHPVLVTRFRACPLVRPPKAAPVPPWKLIRQKKEYDVSSEPRAPKPVEENNFIEVYTPFLNFRLLAIPIPTEPRTAFSSRHGSIATPNLHSVLEKEEVAAQRSVVVQGIQSSESIDYSSQNILSLPHSQIHGHTKESVTDSKILDGVSAEKFSQPPSQAPKSMEDIVSETKLESNETWIEFDDFCKCFQTLYVFHKPFSYPYTQQKTDLKNPEDRGSYYFFTDNLKPTEILVCFSSLSCWGDIVYLAKDGSGPPQGKLTAQHFSWKSLIIGPLGLKMHTHSIKATLFSLPPGRHVLHFLASAVVAHHLQLCSTVPFILGDEETVMPHCEKESFRFIEQAELILKAIGKVINSFDNKQELLEAFKELKSTHYPSEPHKTPTGSITEKHFKAFNAAFWHLICEAVAKKITPEIIFAYRAFTLDVNPIDLPQVSADVKYEIPVSWQDRGATPEEEEAAVILQARWRGIYTRAMFQGRNPGTKEHAIVKDCLQKLWSVLELNIENFGIQLLRHILKSSSESFQMYPCYDDEWNKIAFVEYACPYPDQPANSWSVVFREIFTVSEDMLIIPKVYTNLPFCFLHVINNDTLAEIPIVFNKVTPHVYVKNTKGYTFIAETRTNENPVTAGKWRLRLIGTNKPLLTPSRDTINSHFSVKEFREYYIPDEKKIMFRYSVIVTFEHMVTIRLQTSKPDVFIKLQILNNEEEIISTTGKGQATIAAFQFQPGDRPLSSLSNRSPTLSAGGTKKRRSSIVGNGKNGKTLSRHGSAHSSKTPPEEILPEVGSATHRPPCRYVIQALVLHDSWILTDSEMEFVRGLKESENPDFRVFTDKRDDLTMSPAMEGHAQMDGHKPNNAPHKTPRKGKEKSVDKEKLTKEKEKLVSSPSSRPESRSVPLEPSKPAWVLRIVSDYSEADALEVKKDSDRADQIKSMKQAWESAEPGRSVKAQQARLKFINKYVQNIPTKEQDEAESLPTKEIENEMETPPITTITPEVPAPVDKRHRWEPMDITPFIRKTRHEPVLQNEVVILRKEIQKAEEIRQFRELREKMLQQREEEQKSRAMLKSRIQQMYDDLQVSLDASRERILSARDSYRNKLLEAEYEKQAILASQEAALQADLEAKGSATKKGKDQKSAGKDKGKSAGKKK